jgi:DNA-binding NarL/FixJ family response regulator
MTIRVLIVDDHLMVRRGLMMMLESFEDLLVVGEASNGKQALEICSSTHPDVILMDLVMPVMDGLKATREILKEYPQIKILALTSFSEEISVEEAIKSGAIGYMLKDASIDELARAIRNAQMGKPTISPEAAVSLVSLVKGNFPGRNLTVREKQVIELMVAGMTNPQIAKKLNVEQSTIKSHVSHILRKLGVDTRSEAVSFALSHKLVRPISPPKDG